MGIRNSHWITTSEETGDICPVFCREFRCEQPVDKAELQITALGVYHAEINGQPVGDFVLAPGWTSYQRRLQVQTYDVTRLLHRDNSLCVTIGRGWFRSPMPGWYDNEDKKKRYLQPCGLISWMKITFVDGTERVINSDHQWKWAESAVRFSELYDGEIYDARVSTQDWQPVRSLKWSKEILIPQEGEMIRETERIAPQKLIHTPTGETVIDFGQEITGYVSFSIEARDGDIVEIQHGEVLDANGNFYHKNYRSAKAEIKYICRAGVQCWHPILTFFGFRYIKLAAWPREPHAEDFTGIVVHSDLKRTGWLQSGHAELNQLFSNIVWGQRGNFLDIPSDCPQRDERLGWTGDAQVFVKSASYFFDVERFFRKWLHDMAADQRVSGEIGQVIPDVMPEADCSSAWGDAATICPWQIYQTYGDTGVLIDQFDCMKKWVDFIISISTPEGLWPAHFHFGDWLGLDAPSGSYKGASREDLIANAFYIHSVELVIKAGKRLGQDVTPYEKLLQKLIDTFQTAYPDYRTQTEHVIALQFGLAKHAQRTAEALVDLIKKDGVQLRTGFVGTPYLLHVLTAYGYSSLAWDLLLRRDYPGWLYSVTKGATTVWEHWDGIHPDGSFWSPDMNSFNHYSYGAVADWVFEQAAGLRHDEAHPGFSELIYAPHPDARLGWLHARLDTRQGTISTLWAYQDGGIRYELDTPVRTMVCLNGKTAWVEKGKHLFWTANKGENAE